MEAEAMLSINWCFSFSRLKGLFLFLLSFLSFLNNDELGSGAAPMATVLPDDDEACGKCDGGVFRLTTVGVVGEVGGEEAFSRAASASFSRTTRD